MRLTFLAAMALLGACNITPPFVNSLDVDRAIGRADYETACVGVEMQDDATRMHAAEKLAAVDDPAVAPCVCAATYDAEKKRWDSAILEGLKDSKRDDMVQCALPALADEAVPERDRLLNALLATKAPIVRTHMQKVAIDPAMPADLRIRAMKTLSNIEDASLNEGLIRALAEPSEEIRIAAANALAGKKDPAIVAALTAALNDTSASGAMRAAALSALRQSGAVSAEAEICRLMLEDPAPEVRAAAINAFRATKSTAAVECLRKRAFTKEDDGMVRDALLETLKGTRAAWPVLCDAIPFYMKTYITDKSPDQVQGADIIKAQNDRDFDNSYACVQRALKQKGGWSCKAQQYTAWWFRELGGKTSVPRCPGDPPASGGGGGASEINF